jgi:conjugal transfer pilus assembly protein TraV
MRQSSIKHILLVSALLLSFIYLSGCSALVSPYSTTFQCPDSDKGKCVSVKTAYDESVDDNPLVKNPPCEDCDEEKNKQDSDEAKKTHKDSSAQPVVNHLKYKYEDTLYKKLTSIIEQPETPMVIPPDVVRVLIPSYTGSDNELFSNRYVYFFATEPTWSISTIKEGDE